jgi:hypothetical protein
LNDRQRGEWDGKRRENRIERAERHYTLPLFLSSDSASSVLIVADSPLLRIWRSVLLN